MKTKAQMVLEEETTVEDQSNLEKKKTMIYPSFYLLLCFGVWGVGRAGGHDWTTEQKMPFFQLAVIVEKLLTGRGGGVQVPVPKFELPMIT